MAATRQGVARDRGHDRHGRRRQCAVLAATYGWAERFRVEESEAAEAPRSLMLDLLRRSRHPAGGRTSPRPAGRTRSTARSTAFRDRRASAADVADAPPRRRLGVRRGDRRRSSATAPTGLSNTSAATVGFGEVGHALWLGLVTFGRVVVLVVVATLIWVPIGVWIGLNPKVSRLAQPVVQVLASFPANLLFPMVAGALLETGISLNIGGILLMALGAQWYILFNVIAGASAIPNDLREAAANLRLPRMLRWRKLDPARHLPELRDRRHHCRRRRLERVDRRRDRHLRRHHADRDRTRRLHQGRHGGR